MPPFAAKNPRKLIVGVGAALIALVALAFGRSAIFDFVNLDDFDYVYNNPVVSHGLTARGLVWAFAGAHAGNWHPLTWLSHMLDCEWYGLNPHGHHVTSLVIHAVTVVLLFLFLRQMTGATWRSAMVAAVFAIHPLRVESVVWIAERKDVLSGLFFILTVGAYIHWRQAPSRLRYAAAIGIFGLGLMCKPTLVAVPFVLLALDYWPLRRGGNHTTGGLVREKIPMLGLAGMAGIITVFAQHEFLQTAGAFSFPSRLANAIVSCAIYLRQFFWPENLAVYYPYPYNGRPFWQVAFSAGILAAISWLAWKERRDRPWRIVGWVWYLIMLLPVIGLIQAGEQAHADRYTYLSQIGLGIALVWELADVLARVHFPAEATVGISLGALVVLMACAWHQTGFWRDSETLWPHTLACTTDNEMAHYNYGTALDEKGRVAEAISQFRQAIAIRPAFASAQNNLGLALMETGNLTDAIPPFRRAIELRPDLAEPHINLGDALERQGNMAAARDEYTLAVNAQPLNAVAHNNLGNGLLQTGRASEAAAEYEKAAALDPDYAEPEYSLGNILRDQGNLDGAIGHFRAAVRINPSYAKAHNNLGNALAQKGATAEAIGEYETALRLDPSDLAVKNNLAWLLATNPDAKLRSPTRSLDLATQANQLTAGKNVMVLRTLAAALAANNQFHQAAGIIEKAIDLARANGHADMITQLQSEQTRYGSSQPFTP